MFNEERQIDNLMRIESNWSTPCSSDFDFFRLTIQRGPIAEAAQ